MPRYSRKPPDVRSIHRLRIRGTEVGTGKKTDIFPQGNRLGIFPCTAASRHEQPANGGKRTKRLRFCIASYRTSFNGRKASPPQGSNQRKTKDYGKKAIDRTRKSGHGHADAQHSVCRIHSLHHPFLAHSLKEAPSPAAAFPQRQAAAIFLPSSRHSAYIRFFQAFRQGKRTGPAQPPAGTKTENKKALARDARARCFK